MSLRSVLATAGLAVCAAAATVVAPTPAAATTPSPDVYCEVTTHSRITGTNTYECFLTVYDGPPVGLVWSGPDLDPASNGTGTATGKCRQVAPYWAYYITVSYTVNGVATTTTSPPFLCEDYGPV